MRGLVRAARYLTIVPVGAERAHERELLGGAAAWFPVIGLGIGLVLVGAERVTGWLFPGLLAALLTVTVWKLLTGGLHLDGLADCLDGLAGRDAGQRLRIMRDSRIGAFGAIGLILFLLLEIAAVAELPASVRGGALLATPAIGRATPALLACCFPAARAEGQGATFRAGVHARAAAMALVVAALGAGATLGLPGLAALAAACLGALGLGRFLTIRLGGITGDVLGAAVEAGELIALLTVAAWVHVGR